MVRKLAHLLMIWTWIPYPIQRLRWQGEPTTAIWRWLWFRWVRRGGKTISYEDWLKSKRLEKA